MFLPEKALVQTSLAKMAGAPDIGTPALSFEDSIPLGYDVATGRLEPYEDAVEFAPGESAARGALTLRQLFAPVPH